MRDSNGESLISYSVKYSPREYVAELIERQNLDLTEDAEVLLNVARDKGYVEVVKKLQDVLKDSAPKKKRAVGKASENDDHKRLKKAAECPICFDFYKKGCQIYSCTSGGHFICGDCKKSLPQQICPRCRQTKFVRVRDFEDLLFG